MPRIAALIISQSDYDWDWIWVCVAEDDVTNGLVVVRLLNNIQTILKLWKYVTES